MHNRLTLYQNMRKKTEKKLIMWIPILSRGHTRPFIFIENKKKVGNSSFDLIDSDVSYF